jgi:hypothetical protein
MKDKFVEDIKPLLLNKTVIGIDSGSGEACICRFILDDGTSIKLHGNDLGKWIKLDKFDDDTYMTFVSFVEAYSDDVYNNHVNSDYLPKVSYKNGILSAKTYNGVELRYKPKTDWEKTLVAHPRGLEMISFALRAGDIFWQEVFSEQRNWYNEGVPFIKELELKEKDSQ